MSPPSGEPGLEYANRTGRPPGRIVRWGGRVLPGIREVWSHVDPYADAWHAANRRALRGPGRRWIVLGDSMSQAVGASAWDAGWVDQLAARLHRHGHALDVVNLSATGARVPDVLDQQVPAWRGLPPASGGLPDLVTVLVGSNDLFSGRAHRERLPVAMAELVALLPRRAVVATLPQPRGAARRANAHLDAAAERGDLLLADLRVDGPPSWSGRLAADSFHPNDLGYQAIADAFERPVRRALAALDAVRGRDA